MRLAAILKGTMLFGALTWGAALSQQAGLPGCLPFAVATAWAGDAPRAEQDAFVKQLQSEAPAPAPRLSAGGRAAAKPAMAGPGAAPMADKSGATQAASFEFSDGNVDGSLGTVSMRKANRAAAEILSRRMAEERPDDLKLIRDAVGADVVVVSGVYDRVQDVLRAVQIKHVVIRPDLLDRLNLLSTQTLMVNCPGELSEKAIKKVRDFVDRGGYLVTTDWALTIVARAFPGTIEHNGKRTPNDVVAVHVHDDNEPLLRHVKVMRDHPRWWLEGSSFPIRIRDPKNVRVLMSSEEMGKRYGDSAVVVAFQHGQGKVLHMTSHFFLQQSKLVAESEKKAGREFAKTAGMSAQQVDAMRKDGVDLDDVKAGEINAAYSMQQVSANLLVEKQAANRQLLQKHYRARVVSPDVGLSETATAPAGDKAPRVRKDYRVQVLEKRAGQARIRDLFGNEGWVPEQALAY